jgi:hypothetical protein
MRGSRSRPSAPAGNQGDFALELHCHCRLLSTLSPGRARDRQYDYVQRIVALGVPSDIRSDLPGIRGRPNAHEQTDARERRRSAFPRRCASRSARRAGDDGSLQDWRAPISTCGEPDRFLYRVVAGAVRQCVFSGRGHRHIVDFLRPGDLFGFDARDTHQFSVEPIAAGTTVARFPRNQAERLVNSNPPDVWASHTGSPRDEL